MKEKKKVSLTAVILNCICAVLWNIHVVVDLAYGFPKAFPILLAVAWDFCAGMWIYRYVKSQRNSVKSNLFF